LSPDTSVKLSLSKVVMVVVAIVSLTAGMLAAWYALKDEIRDHSRDNIHLDHDFVKEHGVPVGKWDVQAVFGEFRDEAKGLKESVDKLTSSPIHLENCVPDGRRGVRCNWRP
jgi:hypothetical protein